MRDENRRLRCLEIGVMRERLLNQRIQLRRVE
jgi:hypothetical protein